MKAKPAKAKATPKSKATPKAKEAPKKESKSAEAKAEKAAPKKEAKTEKAAKKAPAKSAKKASKGDDLKKIEGVGPKMSEILANGGLDTFEKVAKASADDIREILAA
ncbi:MAG: helix-hairpin-helix domain-containing protein, partial [Saprospiraceae bacterium]|nr:helix-hairpin-helix domain-containing protein [Saprospiraceae bacterium]